MAEFYCPKDSSMLKTETSSLTCSACSSSFPIKNGVPFFTEQKFYWGEIPEKDMDEILEVIREEGYEAGVRRLSILHPDRLKFVFDVTRADWHWAIDIKPGMKVLDLGCGWGTHSFVLAALGAEVYAVDATPQRVEFVKQRALDGGINNVIAFVGDVFELPFPAGHFDLIISNGVLEWVGLNEKYHSPQKAQLVFLKYIHGLLKKSGVFYVGIENRAALAYLKGGIDHSGLKFTSLFPRFLANWYCRLRQGRDYRTYTYSYNGYKKLFSQAGYGRISTYIPFPGYNYPASLVPFDSLNALSYYLGSRKKFQQIRKFIPALFLALLYRPLVFSYSFYLCKSDDTSA